MAHAKGCMLEFVRARARDSAPENLLRFAVIIYNLTATSPFGPNTLGINSRRPAKRTVCEFLREWSNILSRATKKYD
jgi:hypothetical protein